MVQLTEEEKLAIEKLYNSIKDELQITKMILFGSKARGMSDEYSDIDLLIITNKEKTRKDRKRLSELSAEVNIDFGVALSCLYFDEQQWQTGEGINPFLKENIEKEGVEVVLQ